MKLILVFLFFLGTFSQFTVIRSPSSIVITTNRTAIEVSVVGIPRFSISDESKKWYSAKFSRLYQTQSVEKYNSKIGGTNIALPSLSWEFSNVTQNGNVISFALSSELSKDTKLSFVCHFNDFQKNIKFDTKLEGYDSHWKPSAKYLVLAYQLKVVPNKTEETPNIVLVPNGAQFGAASFTVVPKTESQTNVVTTLGNDEGNAKDKAVFVLYEKFTGTLIHDPNISMEPQPFDYTAAVIIGCIIVIVAISAVVFASAVGVALFVIPNLPKKKTTPDYYNV